jgi:hypothetical protein
MALSLPGTTERAHMSHPDFRVGGKIFATLGYPDGAWGMVKLTPAQQRQFVRAEPNIFVPVKGGWGRRGCTNVCLQRATKSKLFGAIVAAWRNIAPQEIVDSFE